MIWRLTRAYMKGHGGILGIFKLKTRKDSKALAVLMGFLFLYMVVVFGIGFFNMFAVLFLADISKALLMALIYGTIGSMSLLFSESVELYKTGKDLETLFSFPIPRRDVMLSRLLALIEYALVIVLVLLVPFSVAGAFFYNAGFTWFLGSILLTITLAVGVSSMMSFLAIVIPRKLRKPLYLVCTVAFAYIALRYGLNTESFDTLLASIRGGFVKQSISGVPLLYVSGILALLSALFLFLSIRKFDLSEKHTAEHAGKVEYRKKGKLRTMVMLEYQGIRQSDGLMFEIIGEVFIPLIIIVMYVIMGIAGDLMEMVNELLSPTMKNSMPLVVMMVSSGISAISSTSFSREGKVHDILATMPVSPKDRIHGKILFHLIVELPACIMMMLAFSVLLGSGWSAVLLGIPVLVLFTLNSSLWGLLIDSRRTYTTWSEPVEAVKKNMNCMISFLISIVVTALGFVPYMVNRSIGFSYIILTSLVLNLILAPILYSLLIRSRR